MIDVGAVLQLDCSDFRRDGWEKTIMTRMTKPSADNDSNHHINNELE